MSDSSPWSNGTKAEDIAQLCIDGPDIVGYFSEPLKEQLMEQHLRFVGNELKLFSQYPAEVRKLCEDYKSASSRNRNKIKDKLWQEHKVLVWEESSRENVTRLALECFADNHIEFTPEERKRLEKVRKQRGKASQFSISLSGAEKFSVRHAADFEGLSPSSFVTRASYLMAEYIVRANLDSKPSFSIDVAFSMLDAAHSLRDTQLFTADEIRELGLTPEQRERLGGMIARKQAGLQGVKKPVSGGEQTA